jgi:hypothetical protein
MSSAAPARGLIVVAGMHRSGTSLLIQVLASLGAHLGEDVERQPVPSNQTGHWEHAAVWRLQERLLDALGQGWGAEAAPLPPRWMEWPEARAAVRELASLARDTLARGGSWAVKDPRSTRLLPLWAQVAAELGVPLRVVAGRRAPRAVVASLVARDGLSPRQALQLWRQVDAELSAFARDVPVLVLDYDALLADGPAAVRRIAAFCGLAAGTDAEARAAALIRPDLRHHAAPPGGETEPGCDGADGVAPTPREAPRHDTPPGAATSAAPGPQPARIRLYLRTAWNEPWLLDAVRRVLAQLDAEWELRIVADPALHPLIDASLAPYRHLLAGRCALLGPDALDDASPPPAAALVLDECDHLSAGLLRDGLAALRAWPCLAARPARAWVRTLRQGRGLVVVARRPADGTHHGWPCLLAWPEGAADSPGTVEARLAQLAMLAASRDAADCPGALVTRDLATLSAAAGEIELAEAPPLHIDAVLASWPGLLALHPVAGADMRDADGLWLSAGVDPQLHLALGGGQADLRLDAGLYLLRFRLEMISVHEAPRLYARAGRDMDEGQSLRLSRRTDGRHAILVNAPAGLNGLRFDPSEGVPSATRITGMSLARLAPPLARLMPLRRRARVPDVLCIGAQKAGTTWLHHHLQRLPGVWASPVKEFHHFDSKGRAAEFESWKQQTALALLAQGDPALRAFARHLGFPQDAGGWGAYLDLFEDAPPDRVAIDATPAYATLDEDSVRDIARVMPGIRVLFILRDPVERALSGAFHEARLRGLQDPGAETLAALTREAGNQARTAYTATIERWSRHVPPERLRVLFHDELRRDPAGFLAEACAFIGVVPEQDGEALAGRINPGTGDATRPELDALKAELSMRWLPELRRLAAAHPYPCRLWLDAALSRIRAAVPDMPAPGS